MISVEIVAATDKAAAQVTVTLPVAVQNTLISNKVASVKITTGNVSMTFSQTAIRQMNTQAKADVTITAVKASTGKLTGGAKALIGSRPMFNFSATYGNGGKITNFGGNTVSIAIPYTLGKGENPGSLYAVYVDGKGKATKIINSSYDADQKAVIFTTSHFSRYAVGYRASCNFTDIARHWAKTDIEFVTNRGLLSGTSKTTFSPNTAMTRGAFVTALGRLAGVDVNSYKTGNFTDVKADAYYAPYVNWAVAKGITSGTTATTFGPDNSITRQEMAVMMSNYAKSMGYKVPETRAANAFVDNGSIASWAADAVKQMQMAGVLNGKNGNKFDPTGVATCAVVAATLHRYVELVIDAGTAQGWTVNDSGSRMYYKSGKALVGAQTINGVAYTFNTYGETTRKTTTPGATTDAALPVGDKKHTTYTVQKGDSFWLIAKKVGCSMSELAKINGKSIYSIIHPGDKLKIPQK